MAYRLDKYGAELRQVVEDVQTRTPTATPTSNGFLSSADKTKLDEIFTSEAVPFNPREHSPKEVAAYARDHAQTTTTSGTQRKWYHYTRCTSSCLYYIMALYYMENGEPTGGGTINYVEIDFLSGARKTIGTFTPEENGTWRDPIWHYGALDLSDFESPEFEGTPIAPTAAPGTNTTQIATTAFVQAAIATAVLGRFKFVQTLPVTGETGYIYLVPHTHTSGTTNANPDLKDEFIWDANSSSWELIGNTDINLSSHWSKSELEVATDAEVLAVWNNATATT